MTIKVTIKNEDTRETAVIEVEVCSRSEVDPSRGRRWIDPGAYPKQLKGGESLEQWVHGQQDLHIREISQ